MENIISLKTDLPYFSFRYISYLMVYIVLYLPSFYIEKLLFIYILKYSGGG